MHVPSVRIAALEIIFTCLLTPMSGEGNSPRKVTTFLRFKFYVFSRKSALKVRFSWGLFLLGKLEHLKVTIKIVLYLNV